MRLMLVDNYDSFTFNLAQALAIAGAEVEVVRNDALDIASAISEDFDGLVLSPGPGRPEDSGRCTELFAALAEAAPQKPLLGVCLGHQLLAQTFGAKVVRATAPIHGKVWPIRCRLAERDRLFFGLPEVMYATRYHSLVVAPSSLPDCLAVSAVTDEGDIMALRHRQRPLWGVQFHPESIGTPDGPTLIANFVRRCQS